MVVTIAAALRHQEDLVCELELRLDAERIRLVVLRDVHRREPQEKGPHHEGWGGAGFGLDDDGENGS